MRRARAFTLAELATVIAIIAILAAILFPVYARTREQARAASCRANLLNLYVGLRIYAADHFGALPSGLDGPLRLADVGAVTQQTTTCPSNSGQVPFPLPPGKKPPEEPPPVVGPPPGMLPPRPPGAGAPPSLAPGQAPPGAPGAPGGAPGAPPPSPPPSEAPSYVYAPGHYYAEATHALLIADARPRHHSHANVLFTDGSLRLAAGPEWSGLLPDNLARASGWTQELQQRRTQPPAPRESGE